MISFKIEVASAIFAVVAETSSISGVIKDESNCIGRPVLVAMLCVRGWAREHGKPNTAWKFP